MIDVDVEIGPDTVIEPFTTITGQHADRRGLHDPALLPRRLRARGRRQRRAVRLSAPRHGAARGRQGGHVRGGQELRHRRRRESPAPLLHRRRRRGRAHEPRRRRRSPPTTTATPSTARRSAAACATGVDTTLVAPGDGRRRRLHGRRLGDHRGRARRARSASRASARQENIEGYAERSASDEALYTPRRDEQLMDTRTQSLAGEPADRLQQAADAVQRAREPAAGGRHRRQARRGPRPGHAEDVLQRRGLLPLRGVDPRRRRVHRAVHLRQRADRASRPTTR